MTIGLHSKDVIHRIWDIGGIGKQRSRDEEQSKIKGETEELSAVVNLSGINISTCKYRGLCFRYQSRLATDLFCSVLFCNCNCNAFL